MFADPTDFHSAALVKAVIAGVSLGYECTHASDELNRRHGWRTVYPIFKSDQHYHVGIIDGCVIGDVTFYCDGRVEVYDSKGNVHDVTDDVVPDEDDILARILER